MSYVFELINVCFLPPQSTDEEEEDGEDAEEEGK